MKSPVRTQSVMWQRLIGSAAGIKTQRCLLIKWTDAAQVSKKLCLLISNTDLAFSILVLCLLCTIISSLLTTTYVCEIHLRTNWDSRKKDSKWKSVISEEIIQDLSSLSNVINQSLEFFLMNKLPHVFLDDYSFKNYICVLISNTYILWLYDF